MESPLYLARKSAGMTQDEAAAEWTRRWPDEPKLGKTISAWETGSRTPALSTFRRLADVYRCRIADLVDGPQLPAEPETAPLEVAIAVVTRGEDVLLVQRAEDLGWQFVAGTVKPGREPERVAVREVRAETGVHCTVTGELGSRVHPRTRALCRYFSASWLAGEVVNGDPDENGAALWVPIVRLWDFLDRDTVHTPVIDHLGAARV